LAKEKICQTLRIIFETLNNMQMGIDISFKDFLNQLKVDFAIYIDSLCNILTKPTFVFEKTREKH